MENTDVNYEILTVSATDEDATNNAEIQYAFTGMYVGATYSAVVKCLLYIDDLLYSDRFTIDPVSGVIRNRVQLVGCTYN